MNQSRAIRSGAFGNATSTATTDKRPDCPTETAFPHGRWRPLAILFALMAIPALAAQDPSYLRDVRPILDKNCTSCHQPASKEADLDLTTYAGFQAGGKRGPAFVPGSPEQSLVLQLITAALKPSMPFGQSPLAENDVATIREWIKSGARDDSPSDTASS